MVAGGTWFDVFCHFLSSFLPGSSSGIGLEAAKYLIEGGNHVIFGCRDEQKTNNVIDKIKQDNPRGKATFMQVREDTTFDLHTIWITLYTSEICYCISPEFLISACIMHYWAWNQSHGWNWKMESRGWNLWVRLTRLQIEKQKASSLGKQKKFQYLKKTSPRAPSSHIFQIINIYPV